MDTSKGHNVKVNRERQNMNLVKLIERFGSEDRCRAYLETLRWPNGIRCPQCGSQSISRIKTRNQLDCNNCRTRFSVKSGTVFHDSHLPLWKWFLATYLITEAKKGVSANQLKRTLGVSYKTAWYLCHRIRSAMVESAAEPLTGIVEADETYVGGKLKKRFKTKKEAAIGRLANKTVVLGAIERGGKVRLRAVEDVGQDIVHGFLRSTIGDDAEAVYTDSHRSYRGIGDHNTRHEYVDHAGEEWVRGDVHTNTIENVWSLFDRAVIGSYHKLSKKHLPAYLKEFEFRFNGRENRYLFRDTLRALVRADALTYSDLTGQGDLPRRRTGRA
ncbi:MAG: IS1595 family transposase [Actinomycetota bacterium]